MCGISGVINKCTHYYKKVDDFIEQSLITGSLRGLDSTGVYQVDRKGKAYTHKMAVNATNFLENKTSRRFVSDAGNSPVTVCHTRQATSGRVIADNAHPFTAEYTLGKKKYVVVGVHNGTLTGWSSRQEAKNFTVDSDWAINHIATNGGKAFEDFNGAYAFVWWDSASPDTLNIARNKERPLHFVLSDDSKQLYFASEAGMLAWLIERNSIKVQEGIFVIEPGYWYKFDYSKDKVTWIKEKLPEAKSTTSTTSSSAYGYGGGSYGSRHYSSTDYSGTGANVSSRREDRTETQLASAAYGEWEWDETGTAIVPPKRAAGATPAESPYIPLAARHFFRRFADFCQAVGNSASNSGSNRNSNPSGTTALVPLTNLDKKPVVDTERLGDSGVPFSTTTRTTSPTSESSSCEDCSWPVDYPAPDSWYSTAGATAAEQQKAKTLGLMGQVDWLAGAIYEPDTAELLGDIEEHVIGSKSKIKWPAIMRGTTAARAYRHYINNADKGGWVVVIGVSDEDKLLGRTLVVTELSDEGKKQFFEQSQKKQAN